MRSQPSILPEYKEMIKIMTFYDTVSVSIDPWQVNQLIISTNVCAKLKNDLSKILDCAQNITYRSRQVVGCFEMELWYSTILRIWGYEYKK